MKLSGRETSIISAYKPPNVYLNQVVWIDLINELQAMGPVIMGEDLNAQHESWGSKTENQQGRSLRTAIDQSNLVIINEKQATRVRRPGETVSAVDLTIISEGLDRKCSWEVEMDSRNSDHFPIRITIYDPWEWRKTFSTRIPHTKRDWETFANKMEIAANNIVKEMTERRDPNALYQEFIDNVLEALEESRPTRKNNSVDSGLRSNNKNLEQQNTNAAAPWWDDQCQEAVDLKKNTQKIR